MQASQSIGKMSHSDTYRAPAWEGLLPQPRVYTAADPGLARQVTAVLGQQGAVRQLANAGGGSSIFLRLDLAAGGSLFIKVVPENRALDLTAAEGVASWLQAQGVRVVAASSHGSLGDGRELWAYPYHEGRPPEPTRSDMAAIGSELGKLHEALGRHPLVEEWKRQTDARLSRLTAIRQALATGELRAGPDPDLLRAKACERTIDFRPERYAADSGRLPLHGDLNRFNMLIDGSGCTFLDFEDVRHSVLPAIFDLATVFERVALPNQPKASEEAALAALLDAYEATTGGRPDPKWIPEVLRCLALRALCTLADIDPAGRDPQEWLKFFHLMAVAEGQCGRISGFDGEPA